MKSALSSPWKRKNLRFASLKWLSLFCLLLSLLALIGVIVFTFIKGSGKLSFSFLFGSFDETPSILPATIGTLWLILISLVLGVPLGIATAVYLTEYSKRGGIASKIIRVGIETLASIPSIVYGLFGYLVFVVSFGWGYSLLGGGLTLAIMILPLVVKSTEEALKEVPDSLREASFALGAGKVRTLFRVVLPGATPGIVTSIILSIGRVVSESAVLLLTIGMVVNLIPDGMMSGGTSLALDIYYFACFGQMAEAGATSLVLLALVLTLNINAYLLAYFIERKKKHGK